jgi:hypothetical protein
MGKWVAKLSLRRPVGPRRQHSIPLFYLLPLLPACLITTTGRVEAGAAASMKHANFARAIIVGLK